ncbi:MAG TPA: hypothetical protein VGS19_24845 [Streptosporangiaceae bacterium]|nr:hypothetical protein [Streptosporangiaceae bacterium]
MATSPSSPGTLPAVARIDPKLLRTAAVGGLFGGLVMFLLMASYNASTGMGFLTILNVCFAAWVFRGTAMTTTAMPAAHHAMRMHHTAMGMHHEAMGMHHHAMGAAAMMNEPLSASHVIVGALLHLAMSAFAGAAFAVVLAVLIRAGVRVLATPAGYVTAAVAGGALLYVIMMYGFAPLWNTEIVNFTPRVPFFLSHLLFGATIGAWVYWQLSHATAGVRLQARRPRLGGAH